MTLFGTEFSFNRLRQPVNKTDWITHGRPAVVNAYYSSIENSIREFKPKLKLRALLT
jgi:neprilysin